MSHRDDVLALCFYCELAREEEYEAMPSKTEVLTKTKGFSRFLSNKIRKIAASLSLLLFASLRRWRDHWQAARDTFGIRWIREIRVQKNISVLSVLSVWTFLRHLHPSAQSAYRNATIFQLSNKNISVFSLSSDEITAQPHHGG